MRALVLRALGPAIALALVACSPSKQADPSDSSSSGSSGSSGSSVDTGSSSTGGESGSTGGSSTTGSDSGSTGGETPPPGTIERGPKTFEIDGDPNGLWWDAAHQALYLADNDNNRILRWTDADGLTEVGTLSPAPANGPGLGQLVITADGTIVVTRFGYGTAGDVAFLKPDGTAGTVPGLDLTRRRIGLTVTADGTLYDCYFVKTNNTTVGGVARLDLSGSETEVISGLVNPVGVLAAGDDLFVSDQGLREVLRAPLSDPSSYTAFATNIDPDLISAGPAGTLFTGGADGAVTQIAPDGTTSTFVSGYQQGHGSAYDAVNGRLFFADHDPNHVHNYLQIVPVD